jgi:hypothetical protein
MISKLLKLLKQQPTKNTVIQMDIDELTSFLQQFDQSRHRVYYISWDTTQDVAVEYQNIDINIKVRYLRRHPDTGQAIHV